MSNTIIIVFCIVCSCAVRFVKNINGKDLSALFRLYCTYITYVYLCFQGVTKKYEPYRDPRCASIPAAVQSAVSSDILGIVVHTEDLLRDPTQVNTSIYLTYTPTCWQVFSYELMLRVVFALDKINDVYLCHSSRYYIGRSGINM